VHRLLRRIRNIWKHVYLNSIASSSFIPLEIRYLLYRVYGIKTQTRAIAPKCYMGGSNIQIGRGSYLNVGCFIDSAERVEIGADCHLGFQAMLCTATHAVGGAAQRAGRPLAKPIKIGDGCWIGARAIIMPGVTIGDGCVIAAGAVVTSDCIPNSLYAGVPAIWKKALD
jgi:maltose O-acetyltransferase